MFNQLPSLLKKLQCHPVAARLLAAFGMTYLTSFTMMMQQMYAIVGRRSEHCHMPSKTKRHFPPENPENKEQNHFTKVLTLNKYLMKKMAI